MNYIFDIDGTICFDGLTISCDIKDAILKLSQNNNIYFATARPIRDAVHIAKQCLPDAKIIGGNGSITSIKKKLIIKTLNKNDIKGIYDIYEALGSVNILIDYDWDYFYRGSNKCSLLSKIDTQNIAKNIEKVSFDNVIKIAIIEETEKIDPLLFEKFRNTLEYTYYEKEGIHEFIAKNVNKHTSIVEILNGEQYIFFGNDKNDIKALVNSFEGVIVGDQINISNINNISESEVSERILTYCKQ